MKKTLQSLLVVAFTALAINASAQIVFLAEAPASLEGSYNFTYTTGWGADMDTVAITSDVVIVDDSLACDPITNGSEVAGKIAVIYRGDCEFGAKGLEAQNAGAIGVIMINNVSGGAIAMGAGAVGNQVTIPMVMISLEDGALLRPSIDDGSLIVFIGNKTGLFVNDLGHYGQHGSSALSFATPHEMALDSMDFKVPVGVWVHNYGQAFQENVVVNAVIDKDGTEVYNQSSAGDTLSPGDSLFVALPDHGSDNYEMGYYTLSYSTSSDSVENFPNDNDLEMNWWINNFRYSKSRIDPVTNEPNGGGGLRPADGVEYRWCTMMRSNNASAMQAIGASFATTTSVDVPLIGEAVQVELMEWNDPFDATTTTLTFDDLNVVADVFYDYTEDLQGEFVTVYFDDPVELFDDQKYLTCVTVFIDDHFIITDATMDYRGSDAAYPLDVFFPLEDVDGASWFAGGFGSDNVPAIITELDPLVSVEELEEEAITPFPNPAISMINIPLGNITKTPVSLQVTDVKGALVYSGSPIFSGSNLEVDATLWNAGVHAFSLTFEDGSTQNFRVSVVK